jgi:C4-dicarboxylate transporter
LRRDQNFKAWKQKHCCAFTTVLISSTLLSFKLGSIIYSFFLGRKQYLAEFEQQKPYFRITHNLNISFIILGNTPLILLDIGALTFYKWGSQFYIILIETLVISVAMVLLQVFDFRHAKKLIKIEEDLKGVKFDSNEEAKQAQDVI